MSLIIDTLDARDKAVNRMLASYNDVGSRRKKVVEDMSSLDEKEVAVVVDYDGAKAAVTVKGEVVEYNKTSRDVVHPSLRAEQGSAPGNKHVGEIIIPCGVCAIVGAGNTGKSPLAHALASHGVDTYAAVRIGEPLAGYASSKMESAEDLGRALVLSDNIVLDSIKDVLSSGSGAAMKSGLNRDALTAISTWSAQACDMGATVYVPINPSTPEIAVVALIAEAAKSNATSCLLHVGGEEWVYFGRTGEGLERVEGSLTFSKDGKITMKKKSQQYVTGKSSEDQIQKIVIKQVSSFNEALGRLIK